MTEVLFIQGAGKAVHDTWDHALVASLASVLGADYHVRYPRMPDEDDPHYPAWKPEILREVDALEDGSILVGHSLGGTMLLHALAEQPPRIKPGALVLIAAPFIGDGGWPSDELPARTDFAARLPGLRIILVHGTDDETAAPKHARLYGDVLPRATLLILDHRDHQLNNDLSEVARLLVGADDRVH